MAEMVSHPSHYSKNGRKECIVEMVERYGFYATAQFALLSAYKYLYRAGDKDGNPEEQDESKAEWYLNWVTENANKCFGDDIFESKLYWDVFNLVQERKRLPWVTVGNWKPVEGKEIGKPQEKIEVTNFESDWRKNAVYLEDDCK